MRWRRTAAWMAFLALAACWPVAATAQVIVQQPRDDLPVIISLTPVAIQLGKTVEMTVVGERLDGLNKILCADCIELVEVIEAKEKLATFRVRAGSDAQAGVVPLHLLCTAGLSNPRPVLIHALPQSTESEDNNSRDKANDLELPCGVSGTLVPGDVDLFRISVQAGERLVFDLRADRIGSPVRGSLTIIDDTGGEIARAAIPHSDIGPDVRLVHTFTEAGRYTVAVADRTYQGSPFSAYHLSIEPAEFATAMFPMGGRRGEVTKVEFSGGSLKAPLVRTVDLSKAADRSTVRLSGATDRGRFPAPALFAVGEFPEYTELESRSETGTAEHVDLPVTINGRIDRAGDQDRFAFSAKEGQKLLLRVLAQQLGSPLDSVLTVRDAKEKELATGDDTTLADRIPPSVRAADDTGLCDDAQLEFTAPSDGQLTVEISDRYGFGGESYGYRLEIAESAEDFELLVQPGQSIAAANSRAARRAQRAMPQFDGRGTGALSIDRGGRGSLVVKALRRGYAGPIELQVVGTPAGLLAQPTTIAAGQNQALLTFTADFEADSVAGFVSILGTGDVAGNKLLRRAKHPVIYSALPRGAVAQRYSETVAIAVSGRGAELALRGALAGPLTPGGQVMLKVDVRRREGIAGEVVLRAVNPPSGLSIPQVKVADGQQSIAIALKASPDLKPGRRNLQLEGKITVKGKKQPLLTSIPVSVDVRPLLQLALVGDNKLMVSPGKKATIELRIDQNGNTETPIQLATSRLPAGVTVSPLVVPPGAESVLLEVVAGKDAKASPIPRIVQLKATADIAGKKLELPSMRFVLKIK